MVFPVLALGLVILYNYLEYLLKCLSRSRCKLVPAVVDYFLNSKQSNRDEKRADSGFRNSYGPPVYKRLGYNVRVRAVGPGLGRFYRW